ncbi:MAG: ferritin family protein [Planctomycetes bacterium]|nr:ferritin family protein [Planctomycetota bacterium]
MKNENVESILKKAAAKEKGTYLLYNNAADRANDPHTKSVLNKFAAEELKHQNIIENFNTGSLKNFEIDINEVSRKGISEFLTDVDDGLGKNSDIKDLLVYAAKREKNAYEFYKNMSKMVEEADLRKLFVWLANEESKHKEDIEALFWEVMYRE